MDAIYWDGSGGYAESGNTRHTLIMKPAISCDAINYQDGAGTMTTAGVEAPIDAATLAEITPILAEVAAFDNAPPPVCFGVDANGKYLGLVPVSEAAQVLSQPLPAGQEWTQTNNQWVASVSLQDAQSLASAQIDNAAGNARLRYITDVAGQQAVYIEKLQQSQDWVANPTGNPPPYVAAEATAMATDATTAANYIIATANAWGQQLSPAIEGARRAGKIAVGQAADNAAVAAALSAALTQLNAF